MSDDLAHSLGADDYEYLRARARAHLRAVEESEGGAPPSPRELRERRFDRDRFEGGGRERRFAPSGGELIDAAVHQRRFERTGGEGAVAVAPRPPLRAAPDPPPRRVAAPRSYGSRLGTAPNDYGSPYGGIPGRRTIEITGQRAAPPRRARASASAGTGVERFSARPDRIALWAVLLGVFLVLVAVATAHAAVPHLVSTAHHLAAAR